MNKSKQSLVSMKQLKSLLALFVFTFAIPVGAVYAQANQVKDRDDFSGLQAWREALVNKSDFISAIPRKMVLSGNNALFDSVTSQAVKRILLSSHNSQGDQQLLLVDGLMGETSVRNINLHGISPIPNAIKSELNTQSNQLLLVPPISTSADLFYWIPAGKAVVRINSDPFNISWVLPGHVTDLPVFFPDLGDVPWHSTDSEDTSYWEMALAAPLFRGPIQVRRLNGTLVAQGIPDTRRLISLQDLKVQRQESDLYVVAQTVPATKNQEEFVTDDPSYSYAGGAYGYDKANATVYKFKGATSNTFSTEVFSPAAVPPLPFKMPNVQPRQTRKVLVLPKGLGVVYEWRGRMAYPRIDTLPATFGNEGFITAEPLKASKLPKEIFDVIALVIRWKDGHQDLVDLQVGYSRRFTRAQEPDQYIQQNSPNNPKAGTTFRLPEQNVHTSKVEVFYLPQYLWTMNADGRLIERTIRKHSTLSADYTNNQSSPFYAWPTMRLTAMDITSDQYLIYFKGREVWTADLHGLLAHHG